MAKRQAAVWMLAVLFACKASAQQPGEFKDVVVDPAGHGLRCMCRGKTLLFVEGTPEQMGAAQGRLVADKARRLTERVLYCVGGADSLHSGTWFLTRMKEIARRTGRHVPERFFRECDALSGAAGVTQRDGRYANLFPERFHCSGVALRGEATADGQVLHARVLDYMRDINLQGAATVTVFIPRDHHTWVSLGYAGFVGTVTAMNDRGLAIGEMGGRGLGDWDGCPMSFLLRDVMERASNVEEALEIIRTTPRTCEYYYVVSDNAVDIRAMHCTADEMMVLEPGGQHKELPHVPEDTVLVSGFDRAEVLSRRIQAHYGRIDAKRLIEIIKRPVAMGSNLHNAVFAPQSGEMWFADAGEDTLACDEPYAHFRLEDLLRFYRNRQRR